MKIKNCSDCCFAFTLERLNFFFAFSPACPTCLHPDVKGDNALSVEDFETEPPDFCPLRDEPFIAELEFVKNLFFGFPSEAS